MDNLQAIHKVILFGFNYNHNFIEEAFKGKHTVNHLKSKFINLYEKVGSKAVFNCFYCELDKENQEILLNYILLNYKG